MEGVVEDGLCAVVLHRVVGLNIVVGRDTDGLAVRTEGDDGSRGLLASVRTRSVDECAIEQLAHALYLRGLVEGHDIVASTREVDTLAEAADGEAADEDHGGNAAEREALLAHLHEAEVYILHQVLADGGVELLVEPAVLGHLLLIDDAGQEDGSEERAAQTDDPRGGETTDRTRTRDEQDDTRDERGEVGVEDG